MKIDVNFNFAATKAYLKKFNAAMSDANRTKVHYQAAQIWKGRIVRRTPKRWTGQTRRSWVVRNTSGTEVELANTSKVMRYLEYGTRAHGPKRAKMLFVPLTRKAFLAGPRGVIAANKAASAAAASSGGKKGRKRKPPFVVGKDFVFTKRVRGIRAMNIVRDAIPFARATLKALMTRHLVEKLR